MNINQIELVRDKKYMRETNLDKLRVDLQVAMNEVCGRREVALLECSLDSSGALTQRNDVVHLTQHRFHHRSKFPK